MQYVWDIEFEKGTKHFVPDEVKLPMNGLVMSQWRMTKISLGG